MPVKAGGGLQANGGGRRGKIWSLMRIIYRSAGIQSPVDHQLAGNRNWYKIPLYLGLSGDTSDKHALFFTSYFINLNYKFSENGMIAQL